MIQKVISAVWRVKMPDGSTGIGQWTGHQMDQLKENLRLVHREHPYPFRTK
jgi:hypothetical protein